MTAVLAIVAPIEQAALVVDALLLAAEVEQIRAPRLADRYRQLADEVGDALDASTAAPEYDEALRAPLRDSRNGDRARQGQPLRLIQ